MRCGDLPPNRRSYVARNGATVHLYTDCRHIRGTDAAPLRAGLLNPDIEVCGPCAEEYDRHSNVDPHGGLASVLADPDFGPVDLGLSDLGERRP